MAFLWFSLCNFRVAIYFGCTKKMTTMCLNINFHVCGRGGNRTPGVTHAKQVLCSWIAPLALTLAFKGGGLGEKLRLRTQQACQDGRMEGFRHFSWEIKAAYLEESKRKWNKKGRGALKGMCQHSKPVNPFLRLDSHFLYHSPRYKGSVKVGYCIDTDSQLCSQI